MAPIRRLFRQSTSYLARKICRPQTVTVNETEIVILSPPNFLCYFYIPGFPPAKNSRTTKNHNQSGPHSPPLSYSSCAIAAPSSAPWQRLPPSPPSPPAAASAGHRPPPPGARATTAASPLPCRVPGRAPSRVPGPGHPPRAAPSRVKVIAFWTGFIFEFTASLTVLSLPLFSNKFAGKI